MKRVLRILLLALPLSFLIGLWWGHFQSEQENQSYKTQYDLRILSQKNSLPPALVAAFEKQNQLKLELIETEDLSSFNQLLNSQSYDLVVYKSYHLKPILKNKNIVKMSANDLKNTKDIQADFWPSSKYDWQKALPYSWGVNGFVGKRSSNFKKAYQGLFAQKKLKNNLFYLSTDFDHLYFLMTQQRPELLTWVQKSKLDLIKNELNQIKTRVNFADNLKYKDTHFYHTTNGTASKVIKADSDYEFYIPETGTLFWMNFLSLTKNGRKNPESYRFVNYLTSAKTQKEQILNQDLGYNCQS